MWKSPSVQIGNQRRKLTTKAHADTSEKRPAKIILVSTLSYRYQTICKVTLNKCLGCQFCLT